MAKIIYSDQPTEHDQRRTDSIGAQWTPAAQERLTFLQSLPVDAKIPLTVRAEMGYLEGYKNAAEAKDTK